MNRSSTLKTRFIVFNASSGNGSPCILVSTCSQTWIHHNPSVEEALGGLGSAYQRESLTPSLSLELMAALAAPSLVYGVISRRFELIAASNFIRRAPVVFRPVFLSIAFWFKHGRNLPSWDCARRREFGGVRLFGATAGRGGGLSV